MFWKIILKDLISVWVLLTCCFLVSLIVNEMRPSPLTLVYSPPASRINQVIEQSGVSTSAPVTLEGDVEQHEMQIISSHRLALILDARPQVFYRLGHIPSSLNLPRDDFENQYQALAKTFYLYRNKPVVVYCSGIDCQDSQIVANALRKLGFSHVRLFRGGWSDWEDAGQPEERE